MKTVFSLFLICLALASVAIWQSQPKLAQEGKTPLVWVSDDNPDRKQQVALFNELHEQSQLRLDPANTGVEKVIVQSIAGVGPDLFDVYSPGDLRAYVMSGVAWDVTDELKQRGVDVVNDAWPLAQASAVFQGRVYGVPTNIATNAIWIHKDLFEKEGIPIPNRPWTWNEFIEIAKKLTKRDARGRPQQFGFLADSWQWQHVLATYGARIYSEDGTRCTIDSPQAVQALTLWRDLMYKHRVMPSPNEEAGMATQGGWGSGTITLFLAKRGAMAMGGRWWLTQLRKTQGLQLAAVESPHGSVRRWTGGGRSTLINRNNPNRYRALEFLVYLSAPAYNKLLNEQADGSSGMKQYAAPEYDTNPKFPNEDFHRTWAESLALAVPGQVSPFVNPKTADRLIGRQTDLIRIGQKDPASALRDAARDVNDEIQREIARDPILRQQYEDAMLKAKE
jgi:multiple sugar transport system substrate-binding protein